MAYRRRKKNMGSFLAGDEGLKALYKIASEQPVLEKSEEDELVRAALAGDDTAREKIIRAHMRQAFSVAAGWDGYPVPNEEIVSAAMVGLTRAVENFDPDLGNRFSTYAVFWIRSEIVVYVTQNFTIAKNMGTQAQKKLFFNLRRIKRDLRIDTDLDRAMTREEAEKIAKCLSVPADDVLLLDPILSQNGDYSLNTRVSTHVPGEHGNEAIDLLPSSAPSPFDALANQDIANRQRALINSALDALDDRSGDIVRRRHLIDDTETLEELGSFYGVTRERIRQIEAKSLKKMARSLRREIKPSHVLA